MIDPPRCLRMIGTLYLIPRNALVSVTASIRFQVSSVIASSASTVPSPALLNITSSRPQLSMARRIAAWTPSGSDASILSHRALPPSSVIAPATAAARVPLKSAITTEAFSRAKRRAVAAPIPEPPAVTTATLSSNLPVIIFSPGPIATLVRLVASHAEDAVARGVDRRVQARRQRNTKCIAGIDGVEDAVVP